MATFHYCMICKSFNKTENDLKPCARCQKEIEEYTTRLTAERVRAEVMKEMLELRAQNGQ